MIKLNDVYATDKNSNEQYVVQRCIQNSISFKLYRNHRPSNLNWITRQVNGKIEDFSGNQLHYIGSLIDVDENKYYNQHTQHTLIVKPMTHYENLFEINLYDKNHKLLQHADQIPKEQARNLTQLLNHLKTWFDPNTITPAELTYQYWENQTTITF